MGDIVIKPLTPLPQPPTDPAVCRHCAPVTSGNKKGGSVSTWRCWVLCDGVTNGSRTGKIGNVRFRDHADHESLLLVTSNKATNWPNTYLSVAQRTSLLYLHPALPFQQSDRRNNRFLEFELSHRKLPR